MSKNARDMATLILINKLGKLSKLGKFYEFGNSMIQEFHVHFRNFMEGDLHESFANRLYECKPVKIITLIGQLCMKVRNIQVLFYLFLNHCVVGRVKMTHLDI